jgi:hypothetical protein
LAKKIKKNQGGTWPLAKQIKKSRKIKNLRRKKMKKLIAVAAILSVMFLGAGTAQALMGVPDQVPGRDILVPFFIVSMPGMGTDNALVTVTEVMGQDFDIAPGDAGYGTSVHLIVYDRDSVQRYDEWITLTPFDVYVTDALTIINAMNVDDRAACEYDMDGDGTNDCYVGYMHFDNLEESPLVGDQINNLISHVYQIAATLGIVAGVNGVSLEDALGGDGDPAGRLVGYGPDWGEVEALSANALHAANLLLDGGSPEDAGWFRLLLRVYLHNENSVNQLIIWTDHAGDEVIFPGDAGSADDMPLPGLLHVNFFDEEENAVSANITLDHELNFINVAKIYPGGLQGADPLGAGWVDVRTPDLLGNGYRGRLIRRHRWM